MSELLGKDRVSELIQQFESQAASVIAEFKDKLLNIVEDADDVDKRLLIIREGVRLFGVRALNLFEPSSLSEIFTLLSSPGLLSDEEVVRLLELVQEKNICSGLMLARQMGCSPPYISQVVHRKRKFSDHLKRRLVRVLVAKFQNVVK